MITLTLDNLKVRTGPMSAEASAVVRGVTTIRTPKFIFRRNEKPKYDGIASEELFDFDDWSGPAGLYPKILGALRAAGHEAALNDTRKRPHEVFTDADIAWLRDYQRDAVLSAVKRGRCILKLATGAGKGDMTVAILRLLPDVRWLILAHRTNLVRDIVQRIKERSETDNLPVPDIGVFGDGDQDLGNRIIVATYDSLHASKSRAPVRRMLAEREGIIVDECHAVATKTRLKLLRTCPNAYWRIGESGTPDGRADGADLKVIGALGPIITEIKAKDLIDRGILARPTVKIVEYDHEAFASDLWVKVKRIGIQHDDNRNWAVVWATLQARKPAMVFVGSIDHGRYLEGELRHRGLNAELVYGNHGTNQRAAALKRLARGESDVIVASPVFDEGVNITGLEAVVLAGGGQAVKEILQRIGRAMRKKEGDNTFEIWDFADEGHRILKAHASTRRSILKKEGHQIVRVRAPRRAT